MRLPLLQYNKGKRRPSQCGRKDRNGTMILKNGQIFTALGRFMPADVEIEGGRIAKIAPAGTLDGADVLDAAGRYVTPGFVDITTSAQGGGLLRQRGRQ